MGGTWIQGEPSHEKGQIFTLERGTLYINCEKWGAHTPCAPGSYIHGIRNIVLINNHLYCESRALLLLLICFHAEVEHQRWCHNFKKWWKSIQHWNYQPGVTAKSLIFSAVMNVINFTVKFSKFNFFWWRVQSICTLSCNFFHIFNALFTCTPHARHIFHCTEIFSIILYPSP